MALEQLLQNTPTQYFADNTVIYTMVSLGTASVIAGVATLLHKQLAPIYELITRKQEERYEIVDDELIKY